MADRLFTPRFCVMCGFSFTVFLSAFQLLPTAPFHILELGGGTSAAGLFLGFAEVLTVAYIGSTSRDAVAFGLLFLVLLVRPTGLFGRSFERKV